ncbi:Surfeit locus protein 6 -like protein [Triplophysa tibetana]|uniref:Surfeit locus protein 6-like protein n=1 Tax=Triplophysa tibetana TaxID=1572043 RepID=A0A5A9P803_9TELE|nr:Surfeit locus protein 6 -like protein [Triplophysa tibetana]
MASLAAKYDYLEKLTRKVCVSQNQEPKKRRYVPFRAKQTIDGAPPKKKKNKQNPTKGDQINANQKKPVVKTTPAAPPTQRKPLQNGTPKTQKKPEGGSSQEYNAVDILRQRLHQKIEESRRQGTPKDPTSEEVKKKREKRKQERERQKRKKKEFRMKKLAEIAALQAREEEKKTEMLEPKPDSAPTKPSKNEQSSIVFNKVEVGEEYVDKQTKLMEKKKKRKVKGTLTPLTGKNYKQLLTRVEARNAHLEKLRETDEAKAKKEEEKMRWTNVLYKAEGLKIKDNEDMLRSSLKRKEKIKTQKKKKWAERSLQVVEKMQRRQDKRQKNIQKRRLAKVDKHKQRARKKGRVLPADLKTASL